MPSHSASLIDAVARDGQWEVRARLACGCEVDLRVPMDRVLETTDAAWILVGKYPCPRQHPVQRPTR